MEITYATSSNVDVSASLSGSAGTGRRVKVIPLQHPAPSTPAAPSSAPLFANWRPKLKSMSARDWVELFLPCSRWMRSYRWREHLQVDLMAGITVGVMLVPQAMSYAKLAGLHPIYGLYSGFVPIFVYAIFGSSRQLAIGPVALVSLLVSNVLGNIVDSADELYTELAILLAFMVGVLECIMGLLRLGWLIRFISHSVISGFTTSSAIVIALSQAKYFLGYSIVRSSKIVPLVESIIAGAGNFSWPPFVMGSCMLAILLLMKHMGKTRKSLRILRAAGPLTAVVLGTTFVKIFHPSSISVVGEIPRGLPKFSIPKEFGHAKSLIPTALLITGVAILESVGIAKALAAKHGYELDSNQELFGLGVANICGSFFSAYPTTGSFSRSAVNHESGAKTGLSGITMGIIMGCALMFLTPLFREIPQGIVKSRLPWNLLYAIYRSIPEFQKTKLAEMGLEAFLSLIPFWIDLALLMGLQDRWDKGCNAFLSPWGHMTPTLEDVARLTGLRVHGDPVTGTTQSDYRGLARRALGYEDRGLGPLRTIRGSAITDMMGVQGLKKEADETLEEYVARVGHAMAHYWVQTDGRDARRQLRVFLFFLFSRVLFATKGSLVSCRFLTVIADLGAVGSYAWGAAMLAHIFYHLSRVTRGTGIAGFSPFLQVWAYTYLPLTSPRLPRALHPTDEMARRVPYMARWTPVVDRHNMFQQKELVREGLADIREGEICWTPYEGDGTEGQPWVEEGRQMFGRDIFLHALSFVEPLYLRLVTRTLGFPQAVVDTAILSERPRRSQRYVGAYETDWAGENDEAVMDWHGGGTVVTRTASSSAEYIADYQRRYRDRLQVGQADATQEEKIEELEIQLRTSELEIQRLQGVIAELRAEVQRLRTSGASSSRGPSTEDEEVARLRQELVAATFRAEAAEADVRVRVSEITTELASLRAARELDFTAMATDRATIDQERLYTAVARADSARAREDAARALAELAEAHTETSRVREEGAREQEALRQKVEELQKQLEVARLTSGGGDQRTAWRLEQVEGQFAAAQAEVERLRAREIELSREAGGWQNRAQFLEARDRERSQRSHASQSRRTSHVSRPGSKRERREESGAEGGGAP